MWQLGGEKKKQAKVRKIYQVGKRQLNLKRGHASFTH
jgi:hypothetical protein